MRADELLAMRMRGERPIAGLVLIRDRGTRKPYRDECQIVVHPNLRADWRGAHGLTLSVALSSWDAWVMRLLDALHAARPALVLLRDPVSEEEGIITYSHGETHPIALPHLPLLAWAASPKIRAKARSFV